MAATSSLQLYTANSRVGVDSGTSPVYIAGCTRTPPTPDTPPPCQLVWLHQLSTAFCCWFKLRHFFIALPWLQPVCTACRNPESVSLTQASQPSWQSARPYNSAFCPHGYPRPGLLAPVSPSCPSDSLVCTMWPCGDMTSDKVPWQVQAGSVFRSVGESGNRGILPFVTLITFLCSAASGSSAVKDFSGHKTQQGHSICLMWMLGEAERSHWRGRGRAGTRWSIWPFPPPLPCPASITTSKVKHVIRRQWFVPTSLRTYTANHLGWLPRQDSVYRSVTYTVNNAGMTPYLEHPPPLLQRAFTITSFLNFLPDTWEYWKGDKLKVYNTSILSTGGTLPRQESELGFQLTLLSQQTYTVTIHLHNYYQSLGHRFCFI